MLAEIIGHRDCQTPNQQALFLEINSRAATERQLQAEHKKVSLKDF
jgi:hypothetical protein